MIRLVVLLFAVAATATHGAAQAKPNFTVSDIVGEYSWSGGFSGEELKLRKDGTFKLNMGSCLWGGEWEGSFKLENGFVVLSPKRYRRMFGQGDKFKDEDKLTITHFLPVRWGERLYLIEKGSILGFVNFINLGREPEREEGIGAGLLRVGDGNKRVTGFPDLPQRWQEFLLEKPLYGKILSVEKGGKAAWVNLGSQHGLKRGMVLAAKDGWYAKFEVVEVEEQRARIENKQFVYEFKVGVAVSTRLFILDEPKRHD